MSVRSIEAAAVSATTRPWCERLLSARALLLIYIGVVSGATIFKLLGKDLFAKGHFYRPLLNYSIFRYSFFHLIHGQNLYAAFPSDHWDVFKYSPTFALLMAPIAILPYALGGLAWNLANGLAVFAAVQAAPKQSERSKALVLLFVLLSLIVCVQNSQSNGLVAGLMVGGWTARERGKPALSAFLIVLSVFVKLFGALALLPCLLLRRDRAKLIGYSAAWTALLAAAPLVAVHPSQWIELYKNWYVRLHGDAAFTGRSILGVFLRVFHHRPPNYVVAIGAAVLLLVLLLRYDAHSHLRFRLLAVCSSLLWAILFNHMAEDATMVIAVLGVAMWYFFGPRTPLDSVLLALVFVFTCATPTALWPRAERFGLQHAYLDVVPLILVWVKIQVDMLRFPRQLSVN